MSYSIGIDLGTCNSCVSIAVRNQCEVVEINHNQLLPSMVDFTDRNNIKTGSYAKNNAIAKGNVVEGNKRIIGHKFDEDSIHEIKSFCQAEIRADADGYCCYYIPAQNRCVSPEEVNAELIKVMYNAAIEKMDNKKPKAVWITIPASFSQKQKSITRRSAERVINEPIHFISEPSAAAIQYGHDETCEDGNIVVYDLGGGTFDVCIIRNNNKHFEIVGTAGHPTIGGKLFDKLIFNYINQQYKDFMVNEMKCEANLLPECLRGDEIKYQKSMWKILDQCEEAKKCLSSPGSEVANIDIDEYFEFIGKFKGKDDDDDDDDDDNIGEAFDGDLTRKKFEELIEPFIQTTIDITLGLLQSKNIQRRDVTRVLLVGGSSHIPLVKKLLEETFGKEKIGRDINCDNCVSKGAALRGLPEYDDVTEHNGVVDISSFDIAVKLAKGKYGVLIPKDTPLPYTGSKVYHKRNPDLDFVVSSVYERNRGDDYSLLKDICVTDECLYDRSPAIRVDYTLTTEGELTVKFTDEELGRVLLEESKVLDSM